MKQQTPVQWFEQQLDNLDIEIPFWVFNEALEMESEKNKKFDEMLEQQIIDSIQYTIDNFFNGKLAGLNSEEIFKQFKNK
jgi:hypothetical protein